MTSHDSVEAPVRGLEARYFNDVDIFRRTMDQVFYKSWLLACHSSQVAKPGDYLTLSIYDQDVVVAHDRDEGIRAFYNVCQHRAHRLLEDEGTIGARIVCPYHNWAYALTGELLFARGSELMDAFPRDEICLQPVRVDSLCGFVFVNLDDDAAPLAQTYPGLEDDILALAPDAADLERAWTQDFPLAANWKNSVENYSECYHCPNRHPSLVGAALDIERYRIDIHDNYHRHVTSDVGDRQGYAMTTARGDEENFGSWLLFPNMVFEVYPGGNLTVFNHVPTGPERCVQETEWYFAQATPSAAEREVIDFVNRVREEDLPICESVQRGLHSHGYKQGKFIVDPERGYVSEHAVHDFQRRVLASLDP